MPPSPDLVTLGMHATQDVWERSLSHPIMPTEEQSEWMRSMRHFVYRPKADITAHELAVLMPYLMGKSLTINHWEKLGVDVGRHFELVDRSRLENADAPAA